MKTDQAPFMEIVEGLDVAGVVFRHGGPMIVDCKKAMYVPMDDSPQSHLTRIKMMAHAKWTQTLTDTDDAAIDVVKAVEGVRILTKMALNCIDVTAGNINRELYCQLLEHHIRTLNLRALTLLLLENAYSSHLTLLVTRQSMIEADVWARAVDIYSQVIAGLSVSQDRKHTHTYSKYVEDQLFSYNQKKKTGHKKGPGDVGSDDAEELDERDLDALRGDKSFDIPQDQKVSPDYDMLTKKTVPWGTLMVEPLNLTKTAERKKGDRRLASTEEGVYLRDVWRAISDRQIFTTKRKRLGGAVLIDGSGSMSLSSASLKKIALAAPAVNVAVYSGTDNTGKLRVLVKNGRMVEDRLFNSPYGHSNVVDVPALQDWLAKQPQPRIWVSDGSVTGINDTYCAAVNKRVYELVKKYRIIRASNMTDTVKLFNGLVKGTYARHPAHNRRGTL